MIRRLPLLLTLVVVFAQSGLALAGMTAQRSSGSVVSTPGNYIDARQFTLNDSMVPGSSIRQNVTAWQVNLGRWNGQNLDGLSVVLVEQFASEGDAGKVVACYVSEFASPAQREALLAALQCSQPRLKDAANIRLEPACIRIDIDGQNAVIHLGLIA
jgi:hypothetical protein